MLHGICYHKIVLLQISDFGMSRDLEEANYYVSHGGKVPVKWTAPEVCVASYQIPWNPSIVSRRLYHVSTSAGSTLQEVHKCQ